MDEQPSNNTEFKRPQTNDDSRDYQRSVHDNSDRDDSRVPVGSQSSTHGRNSSQLPEITTEGSEYVRQREEAAATPQASLLERLGGTLDSDHFDAREDRTRGSIEETQEKPREGRRARRGKGSGRVRR